jgi:hypothetical protein
MNISKQTKRDIIDTLRVENIQWHGILDEISFLERVFNLDELPGYIDFPGAVSTNIRTEIKYSLDNPHRCDWNFYDDQRFNLIERDDEIFLKFLCEMLHPIVRPDGFEVLHLLKTFNQYLALDKWEIFEIIRIGDKPIFSVRQLLQFPVDKLERMDDSEITKLITKGESAELEFKSSARWDIQENKKNKVMEEVILKTVAGFLNSYNGGTLLNGVNDEGKVIGLDHDYQTVPKKDRDGYELFLTHNLLLQELGDDLAPYIHITFHRIEGKDICCITLEPSPREVYVKLKDPKSGESKEHFFLRTNNLTKKLEKLSKFNNYCRNRWH